MTLSRWFSLLILVFATNCFAGEQLADLSEASLPVLNEELRQLRNSVDRAPMVYTGTAAPTTTPQKIGDVFIDSTNHKVYISDGTTDSTDWVALN
jgi:hypothetical protein